jgi:hypothetical protein
MDRPFNPLNSIVIAAMPTPKKSLQNHTSQTRQTNLLGEIF